MFVGLEITGPEPKLFHQSGTWINFVTIFRDTVIETVGMVYGWASETSIDNFVADINILLNNTTVTHNEIYTVGESNGNFLQYHRSNPVADFSNNFFAHGL